MFSCTKKLFCVQTHERSKKYHYAVTQIPRDGYCNLTLADLPWDRDRDADNWEYVNIRPYKLNDHGMYAQQLPICIPEQSEWILEKYMHDVNTSPLYTVEDMERELGIQSEFQYGVKPSWDWLFATMSHVPRYLVKHMDSHTEAIYSRANTKNVLDDLRVRLAAPRRQYRRQVRVSSQSSNINCRETVSEPVNIHTEIASKPVKSCQELFSETVNFHSELTTETFTGNEYKAVKESLYDVKVEIVQQKMDSPQCAEIDTRASESNQKTGKSPHQSEVDQMKPESVGSNNTRSIVGFSDIYFNVFNNMYANKS